MFRQESIGRYYEEKPQLTGEGIRTWITRGANFAVVCSIGEAGASLSGRSADEHFVYALEGGIKVIAGDEQETLDVEELAIVPPGEWSIHFDRPGHVYQLITADEVLTNQASNAALYADGASEVAQVTPSLEPVGGYRLRRYSTLEAYARGGLVHAFRTRKLMMVPYNRFLEPRDETTLTPHAHADFEQGSIGLEGEWVHHLRVPWTSNRQEWRPDIHMKVASPSVLIIPAGVIHTSQGVAGEGMRLVDVFSPPRMDFSERGWVDNAADYPLTSDESITANAASAAKK